MLSDEERIRYTRQLILKDMGESAQIKLKRATVLIAGAGGLGSPVSLYLAAAGVGNIIICDSDTVNLSNLNRQILHKTDRIGMPKTKSAQMSISELNPLINVDIFNERISNESIERITGQSSLIIDCLDNIETRYTINCYAIKKNIPIVHGGINGLGGQVSFIVPGKTPCLRCIFPAKTEQDPIPVLGATAGIIGSIQAVEAIKFLTGIQSSLENTLLLFDGFTMSFDKIAISKNPCCEACGELK